MLMGLSGSGKSTLLRCVNRLIEPTSGTITIDDEDITLAEPDVIRDIRRKKSAWYFSASLCFHRTVLIM